jgi:hypothetical protein
MGEALGVICDSAPAVIPLPFAGEVRGLVVSKPDVVTRNRGTLHEVRGTCHGGPTILVTRWDFVT